MRQEKNQQEHVPPYTFVDISNCADHPSGQVPDAFNVTGTAVTFSDSYGSYYFPEPQANLSLISPMLLYYTCLSPLSTLNAPCREEPCLIYVPVFNTALHMGYPAGTDMFDEQMLAAFIGHVLDASQIEGRIA